MGDRRVILCTVIVFTILVFGSVFEETILPAVESQLSSTLKITKLTTGGGDTFDFTVSGPLSYTPSINTVGGFTTYLDTTPSQIDAFGDFQNDGFETTFGQQMEFTSPQNIARVTLPSVNTSQHQTNFPGQIYAVLYSSVSDGSTIFTVLGTSNIFEAPWTDDGAGGTFIDNSNHDVVFTFNPPVTVFGEVFVGFVNTADQNGNFDVQISIADLGGDEGNCIEQDDSVDDAFHTGNKCLDQSIDDILMKIETFAVGGIGIDGPTLVEAGTYYIQETIPVGWSLTTATCNDGSSSFSVDTVSGIVIDPGDNIECTFENTFAVPTDTDGDGIFDDVDTLPNTISDDFSDIGLGGTSSGVITTRGDQILTITEEPNPAGVRITADISGGLLPAVVNACGGISIITLSPGDNIVVTCGSVTIDVINGPVDVAFISSGGTQATTSLSAGNSITFDQDNFSFVAPSTNTQTIIIDVEGTPITISPGDTNTSPPEVGTIIASQDPVQVGTLVEVSATFTDLGPLEVHTAEWDWGDQTTTAGVVTENGLSGTVTGSHTYSTPGVYTVILTVTDDTGDSGSSTFQFVVIYDPSDGFVTGGGWIDSPEGTYVAEPLLVGKATFGFVSKYQHDANVPTGNTQFSFQVADLKFKSTEYDWLVVAGSNAKFKGIGTINGQGNYGFQLFGFDADVNTNDSHIDDKFRIKIWDKNNGDIVVYDNELGQSEDSEPSTIIGGGSIVIHQS